MKVTATRIESIKVLMNLTKDMTVIEEKLTSQVAMETEADEVGFCFFSSE